MTNNCGGNNKIAMKIHYLCDMKANEVIKRIKPWMLPIAMLGGILFHEFIDKVAFMAPYLLFVMLLVTFCKVRMSEFRITSLSWSLLSIQIAGAIVLYFLLLPMDEDVAQAVFMCVFCPTATAAPVVTGMLGGSISRVATFSVVSNVAVAITAPFLFSFMNGGNVDFIASVFTICGKVMPLLLVPLIIALLLRRYLPKIHGKIEKHQPLSFYLWAVTLFIVVGKSISFVLHAPSDKIVIMIVIAVCAGIVCAIQFYVGRIIGRKCGDRIAGAQGLGQKNTVLGIWMTLTYLNPMASIGPAAYIAWQNTINSMQLYYKVKKENIKK